MIELNEDSYILGYWFCDDEDLNAWYLCILKEGENWLIRYTFRYKSEETSDPFDGKDKKRTWEAKIPISEFDEEMMIQKGMELFEFNKSRYSRYSDHFLVKGNLDKFLSIAKTKDYMHIKEVH